MGKEGADQKYTQEQINEFRMSRALADAKAIQEGAIYVEGGRLEFRREQIETAKIEHTIKSAQLPKAVEKEILSSVSDFLKHVISIFMRYWDLMCLRIVNKI
jgi:hypothetical protein